MKNHSIFIAASIAALLSTSKLNAQTDWKLSGNTVTTDSRLGTNNGYDLIMETGNYERMRITDGGKIGIGLASPEFTIDVFGEMRLSGELRLTHYSSPNANEPILLSVGSNGLLQSKSLSAGGGSGSLLQDIYSKGCFPYTSADGTITAYHAPAWISEGGPTMEDAKIYLGTACPAYVGIGTSEPEHNLHVNGDAKISRLGINANPGSNALLNMKVTGQNTNGINMTIESIAEDRIGLRINATTTDDIPIQINNITTNKTLFEATGKGEISIIPTSHTGRALVIKDAMNADAFRFGTDGVMWSTEVNVALKQDFPDYVFDDGYALMPLEQLGKYISENKHLPNVPTAAEVAANGLNLGEMQRIQMEKTEENTLYILQLEDRLKKLEEQNAQLAKLIVELQNK